MELGKRLPAVAGAFYPARREELTSLVRGFFDRVPSFSQKETPRAILVPHAGYVYSGQVAAFAYTRIRSYQKVLILGPSHFQYFHGVATDVHSSWVTPIGEVPLMKSRIARNQEAHSKEHCLEVQLPFLQTVLSDFAILPLLVGEADSLTVKEGVLKVLEDDMLLVISSDLSHYYDYDTAVALDRQTIQAIKQLDDQAVGEACGRLPIQGGLLIARERAWRPEILSYQNSGDVSGDHSQVVGYVSVAFYA